jgi:hypothetical protein
MFKQQKFKEISYLSYNHAPMHLLFSSVRLIVLFFILVLILVSTWHQPLPTHIIVFGVEIHFLQNTDIDTQRLEGALFVKMLNEGKHQITNKFAPATL